MVIAALLRRLKQTPMDLNVLGSILPSYATTMQYKQLKGKHRSEVFRKYKCIVLRIPSSFSKIGHFVVLLRRPKSIEYFSSLGGSPESELQKLGQDKAILMKLLGSNYIYNSKPLQSKQSTIHSCALHCLARIVLHDLKLQDYQKMFSRTITLTTADDIVSMLTILMVADL